MNAPKEEYNPHCNPAAISMNHTTVMNPIIVGIQSWHTYLGRNE